MARKKKEINPSTIDNILKYFKDNLVQKSKMIKLDGITIECTLNKKENAESVIDNIKLLCSQLKIKSVSVELDDKNKNICVIQFPELVNNFTEKEEQDLYEANFKWLLDNLLSNDIKNEITDQLLRATKYKELVVKHAITTYYRSYANQYKQNITDYLDNIEYKNKIKELYNSYLEEYLLKRNNK